MASLQDMCRKRVFLWKDILKLLDTYKGLSSAVVFDGSSCSLWDDLWARKVPRMAYHELFSFAKIKNISIKKALNITDLHQLFHLPLQAIAFEQVVQLAQDLEDTTFGNEKDIWSYIWGSFQFSSSKAYRHLIGNPN